jgi:hypothetical protein
MEDKDKHYPIKEGDTKSNTNPPPTMPKPDHSPPPQNKPTSSNTPPPTNKKC